MSSVNGLRKLEQMDKMAKVIARASTLWGETEERSYMALWLVTINFCIEWI